MDELQDHLEEVEGRFEAIQALALPLPWPHELIHHDHFPKLQYLQVQQRRMVPQFDKLPTGLDVPAQRDPSRILLWHSPLRLHLPQHGHLCSFAHLRVQPQQRIPQSRQRICRKLVSH